MNNKINVFGFSIINSAGFSGGNESNSYLFSSQEECLSEAFKSYQSIWNEALSDGVLDQDKCLSFNEFVKTVSEQGYAYIQCYDSHVQFECFAKELELDLNKSITVSDKAQQQKLEKAAALVNDLSSTIDGRRIFDIASIVFSLKESEGDLSQEEILQLTERIYEASFMTDVPLLTAERVDAVCSLLEYGITEYKSPELPSASPEQAKELLLTCNMDVFIDLVETVAVDNQVFYAPEYSEPLEERLQPIKDAILGVVNRKLTLDKQVKSASEQSSLGNGLKDVSVEHSL